MATPTTAASPEVDAADLTPTVPLTESKTIASLYVGDLDPTVRESQLVEVFKPCGNLLGVRICRDIITQRSLGYGYVNFQQQADADRALQMLNFKLVGDRPIRLMYQQREPSLRFSGSGNIFVKNLQRETDSKGLYELFKPFGNILSCKVMKGEDGSSRRYGFVHFKDEGAALEAITKMNGESMGDLALYVAHFIRRNARIAALMANFTNVYIKQVLPTVDKEIIDKFFSKFGGITSSITKKDPRGRVFGFCNFATHDEAVKCIEAIHGKPVEGLTDAEDPIYVQRAQPRSERLVELRSRYVQRQSMGNNLYVRNFGRDFTDGDLYDLFKEYGDIRSAKVMVNEQGNSRGFGFVSFTSPEMANTALREMNGRMLNGKPLVVNIAQRRDQRYSMLQVQFQQRLHALLRQAPLLPPMMPPMMPTQMPRRLRVTAPKAPPPPNRQQLRRQPAPQPAAPPAPAPEAPTPTQPPAALEGPPQLAPITKEALEAMSAEDRNVALGERLFVAISDIAPEFAPKITGMFLELDVGDAYTLLTDRDVLQAKVTEALCVLRAHQLKN